MAEVPREKSLPPEVQQLILQYQTLREHYARIEAELRTVEAELGEINSISDTLKNLDDNIELYKSVGHVLVKKTRSEVLKELEERKELLTIKRDKYMKQLDFLNKQIQDLEGKLRDTLAKHGITIGQ
ncbi:MAG: prefoldin subunit beta [Desulfurococcaceae archaeon]|jgi:prefoldin beta subunit|nr:prefoldin subunit beta [Desulfurococcaceae archaeon]MCC6053058.1 prefoldin subunit beta [Desulfurococcaceae archaeon]